VDAVACESIQPGINSGGFVIIDVIDVVDLAHQEKRRKNIFNTRRFHA
jgi:hypothetical protein